MACHDLVTGELCDAAFDDLVALAKADPNAFVQYYLKTQDQLQLCDRWGEVHFLYRLIHSREVQKSRRLRLERALEVVEAICGRRLEPDERERVARNLEETWAQRRSESLKAARSKTSTGRLSLDERAEQVRAFWEMVDGEIARGEVNGWDDKVIDDLALRFLAGP